jgi:hypothetical protein
MRRGSDDRPSVFKTFRFASFDESAAFVAQLSLLGPQAAELIRARVARSGVRVRIDPHPETGKAAARKILEELEALYRNRF